MQDIKEDAAAPEDIVAKESEDSKPTGALVLDGIPYHTIDAVDIPPAFAEVPVTLNDNGAILPVCFLLATLTH